MSGLHGEDVEMQMEEEEDGWGWSRSYKYKGMTGAVEFQTGDEDEGNSELKAVTPRSDWTSTRSESELVCA